ncbi:MAG: hypothetical protein C4313_03130 [Thermoflexus sp.]|uniref:glycosyltransferase family 87 protein n=1 Tax=Thermoflexus sp. TaxID=1969742 RepID=UPI00332F3A31
MMGGKGLELLSRAILLAAYAAAAGVMAAGPSPVDYPVYLMTADGFRRGENVYRWTAEDYTRAAARLGFSRYTLPYRYPPLTALLVQPLVDLPDRGRRAWVLLQALGAWATAEVLAGSARTPQGRAGIRLAVGLFPPFFVSLYAGQVNPLATALLAGAFWALRRGREGVGGSLLGISMMVKPIGVGLAAYLLWRGRWRALGATLGEAGLALGLSLLAFGPAALGFMGLPARTGAIAYPPAQSLPGLAARWLTHHPYGFSIADRPDLAQGVGMGLALGLVLVTLIRSGRPGTGPWSDRVAGGWLMAALLANPGTWYHHFTIAAIPLAVRARCGPTGRWGLLAAYSGMALWSGLWRLRVGFTPLLDLATLGGLLLWVQLMGERVPGTVAPPASS